MHWNPRQVPLAQPLCTCVHDNVPMSYICMLQQEEIVTELYTRGELMEEEKGRDDCPSSTEDEEDKDLKKIKESVGYIFREADWIDNILMILGTLGCFADGSSTPVIMLVLSNMMNSYATTTSFTLHDINKDALNFVYVAIGVGLGALLEGLCWARTAERQTSTLRKKYLSSLLKQEPAFFDTFRSSSTTFQVVSSISTDTLTIQDAISEKIPNFLMSTATFLISQTAALYLSWRLAVVTIPTLSLLILPGIVYGKILMDLERKIQEAYVLAGGIAEQALSSIRTVFSYVGENKTAENFSEALEKSSRLGIKQGLMKGMAIGSIGVAFAVWAFQAWYGSVLVTEKGARGGDVFTSGVCVVVGGLALGGALANLKYLSEALVATSRVYEVIDRIPSIDPQSQDGETMTNIRGEIEFKDVDFAYPSRPKSMVLEKFNLRIKACQTLGLVGASGSGKSTLILLLERFYAPVNGEIVLDGVSIEKLQLTWLRQQIGLVSQEPALFQTSIKENIMFAKECASMEEVIRAAKAANAHSFIKQLPKGYDTQVGQYGSQLSGGQKQRIAIARALLREPKILLLDEATSALDSESEKVVQDALIHASVGKTTIIVAHRLSTLHKADLIAVLQSGEVIESGPHNQLIENTQGIYSTMLKLQQISIMDNPYMTGKASNEERAPAYTEDTKSVNLWRPDNSSNQMKITQHQGADCTSPSLRQSLHMTAPESKRSTERAPAYTEDTKSVNLWKPDQPSNEETTSQHQEDDWSSPSLRQLLHMTAPEWKRSLLGITGALGFGAIQPIHSYIMGALLSSYFLNDPNEIRSKTKSYCSLFLINGFLAFITNVIQHYNFGVTGEYLTKRVRQMMLTKTLTFEIGWFDTDNNSSGVICSRLSAEASKVRRLVCDRISLFAHTLSAAVLAIILSMALSWRLAVVIVALQPLIIGSFYGRGVLMKSMSKKVLKAQQTSTNIASECVWNHRIIMAFTSQVKIMELFSNTLGAAHRESKKQSWYAGLGLLVSQFLTAANVGLIFWYGGRLLHQGMITYKHLFQTFFILVTTGRVIAEAGAMTSDLSKGASAIKSVFMILSRKSKIEPNDPDGIRPQKIDGYVEFKEVSFVYPSRPDHIIFNALSLKVDAGRTVALVGQSGSGKSTIIALVERFYDTLKGSVEIDGVDIKRYNLRALRSHIALVSQEPTLFADSVHENIAYGKENATEAEVIEAATLANAHEFISGMKDGYKTYCGERGLQLSGGQKQRIALARAILKNPAILLLDEATSALDYRSESLVQEAVERIFVKRTCLVVAHRISTIKKSDSIAVVANRRIVEEGTHDDLMSKGKNGAYYSLVKIQSEGLKTRPTNI